MSSIIPGYEYDVFISYRQKDNKYDGWVTEFVNNLKKELQTTLKDEISIYVDENEYDGLLEMHNIDKSLESKLKSLILIPIISQTYCDQKSYAWQHEFCEFNRIAKEEQIGRDIRLVNGNVISRILPVKIHELDTEDKVIIENELGGILRSIDFIYRESGVNRPLNPKDNKIDNQNKTDYRNQVNKLANALKEIIGGLKNPAYVNSIPVNLNESHKHKIKANEEAYGWFKKAEFRITPEDNCDIDSCIIFLKKAIEADPSFALAHAELSKAYSYKNYFIDPDGRFDEKAFVEAEMSLFLDPDLAEGHFAKAYGAWTFKNKFPHEKVIREYKKAISIKPDLDIAFHYLGVIYMHVGLIQESIDMINKAIQINPDNRIASLDLISTYYFSSQIERLELVNELYKQTSDHLISPLRASFWAISLIILGRLAEAEKILSARIKRTPSDMFINSALAVFLAKKGDKSGALDKVEFCEQSNLTTGHFHHAYYNLALADALLGRYQESVDKLIWVSENGFPCYTLYRDDPLLSSLHKFGPYNDLIKRLEISWKKFRQISGE